MEWDEENWFEDPIVIVQDGSAVFSAYNTEALTLAQVAEDYGDESANQESREITVRQIDESGVGTWQTFTVPVVPPPPLENLSWNQGWPPATEIPYADVLDDNTHFNAPNPEGWTLARCAADYGNSYACENKTPHEVQIREVSAAQGNGAWQTETVPVVEE
jgi:hypothetical protein